MGNSPACPSAQDATALCDVIVSARSMPPVNFTLERSLGRVIAYSRTYSRSSGDDDVQLEAVTNDSRKLCLRMGGNCILGVLVHVEMLGGKSTKERLRLVLTGDMYLARKASSPIGSVSNGRNKPLQPSPAVHIINGKGKRKHEQVRQAVLDGIQGIEGGLSFTP